jgi:hypothetical protein
MVRGALRLLRRPADVPLLLSIGAAILLTPLWIARANLRDPRSLRKSSMRLPVPRADQNRILWLRGWWLNLPFFRRFNTCYVRAIVMYRFLQAPEEQLKLHLGIERRDDLRERLRGHAWVTLNGTALEAPTPVLEGRVREIRM